MQQPDSTLFIFMLNPRLFRFLGHGGMFHHHARSGRLRASSIIRAGAFAYYFIDLTDELTQKIVPMIELKCGLNFLSTVAGTYLLKNRISYLEGIADKSD